MLISRQTNTTVRHCTAPHCIAHLHIPSLCLLFSSLPVPSSSVQVIQVNLEPRTKNLLLLERRPCAAAAAAAGKPIRIGRGRLLVLLLPLLVLVLFHIYYFNHLLSATCAVGSLERNSSAFISSEHTCEPLQLTSGNVSEAMS